MRREVFREAACHVQYYCQTLPGLEGITAEEIGLGLPRAVVEKREPGRVFFDYRGAAARLLKLGTAEDVFALVGRERLETSRAGLAHAEKWVREVEGFEPAFRALRAARPRRVRRVTFRVVVQRSFGRHAYPRKELGRRLGRAVERRFGRWREVDENAVVELWVLQQGEDTTLGIRLSDRTMRHRTYRRVSLPASLRPVLARAMVIRSEPRPEDVFLDPMCGSGTLLIERGLHGRHAALVGGDVREEAVAATRANVGPRHRPIQILRWDARRLSLRDESVNRVVCNLPFGRRINRRQDLPGLYRDFLQEVQRVLAAAGVVVLLTSEDALLQDLLQGDSGLRTERRERVLVLGRRASIFTARR